MSKTFSIKTLGCKLNQYESVQIADRFINEGWIAKSFGEEVDIVVVNTCTVTDRSDKKCRNYIRQGAKFSKTGKTIITGCMAEKEGTVLDQMKETLAVFDNKSKSAIYEHAESVIHGKEHTNITRNETAEKILNNNHIHTFKRTREYLKVQDGCDGKCSYCIVPSVRGVPVSRPMNHVVEHARKLISDGCPELILTGITIGKYNYAGYDLSDLVEKLINLHGDYRIRITSIEPNHVTDKLLDLYNSPKICNHIHLPLQSGSYSILKKMRREYSADDFKKLIERIKLVNPELAIGSDIIVGFPGESDLDFEDSLSMIKWAEFSYVHTFRFSKRSGTEAAKMVQTASDTEISGRIKTAKSVSSKTGLNYRKKYTGKLLQSVIQRNKKSETYEGISDNYIKIRINKFQKPELIGKICNVKLLDVDKNKNTGIIID